MAPLLHATTMSGLGYVNTPEFTTDANGTKDYYGKGWLDSLTHAGDIIRNDNGSYTKVGIFGNEDYHITTPDRALAVGDMKMYNTLQKSKFDLDPANSGKEYTDISLKDFSIKRAAANADAQDNATPAGMSGLDQWKVGLGIAQFANGLYNDSKQRGINNRMLAQKDKELGLMKSKFDMTAADVGYNPAGFNDVGFDEFGNTSDLDKYSTSQKYAASTAHSRARNNANLAFG